MEDMLQESNGIIKLDLEKYGLSHLKNSGPLDWSDSDLEKIMDACAAENIAPALFGIKFSPENVNRFLDLSHCRRCGRCCLPNPIDPDYPGVMVDEEDLKLIAKHSHYSYKYLKKKAILNTDPKLPQRRYLPLPCIFYNEIKKECKIYEIRPVVCRTFPITDLPGQDGISINLCEYGKDIYRNMISKIKKCYNSKIRILK
jgi:Fe-S-cluster containining protein